MQLTTRSKPTVERFFKTLREGLIQYLPAYKGPDVHSRGEDVESAAFLYLHELEDVIREWVALVYHCSKHDGLAVPEWPHLDLSPNDMFDIGVARAGLLRIPASPELAYDFLDTVARTIQHYGVEVNGLRYNGPGLDPYRNARSPYGGALAGKWPLRVNPDDVRHVWFQDPDDHVWHRLDWEHAAAVGAPFSFEAAQHARRLSLRNDRFSDRFSDQADVLTNLLARWGKGMVTDRRERRMALRLSAERAALPALGDAASDPASDPADSVPGPAAGHADAELAVGALTRPMTARPAAAPPGLEQAPQLGGDADDDEEIFDDPVHDEGFYDDAFEILT